MKVYAVVSSPSCEIDHSLLREEREVSRVEVRRVRERKEEERSLESFAHPRAGLKVEHKRTRAYSLPIFD